MFLQAKDIPVKIKDSEDFETHLMMLYVKEHSLLKGTTGYKYEKISHAKRNIVIHCTIFLYSHWLRAYI